MKALSKSKSERGEKDVPRGPRLETDGMRELGFTEGIDKPLPSLAVGP